MAETDVHRQAMIDTIETLADFFRDEPDVYVAGNLLLYYEEGNPAASVAPDAFVVRGVRKGQRRTYRLWEEGQPPMQGFRLADGHYERMGRADDESLLSEHLGLRVRIEDKRLRLIDAATGERLLSPAEVAEARRLAERRLAETEAELARLREELARLRSEADTQRST